ncbi:MAG TPA: DUF559 domain-containing protein [Cellulomonas sp.]|nr:DUF559 domain-containing protein [Cellulomonas sp.]
MPVTTKRRTIIDCLGRMSQAEAERLVAWVATRKLLSANELERWLEARRGAWGNAQRRISERRLRTGAINPAEERLHAALHAAGITGWTANEPLLPILGVLAVAYVYFADVLLVVEIDGRSAHGPAQFQQDRDRHNALVAAGCTPLHFTWEDVRYRPDHVVATIARQLEMLRRRQVG